MCFQILCGATAVGAQDREKGLDRVGIKLDAGSLLEFLACVLG